MRDCLWPASRLYHLTCVTSPSQCVYWFSVVQCILVFVLPFEQNGLLQAIFSCFLWSWSTNVRNTCVFQLCWQPSLMKRPSSQWWNCSMIQEIWKKKQDKLPVTMLNSQFSSFIFHRFLLSVLYSSTVSKQKWKDVRMVEELNSLSVCSEFLRYVDGIVLSCFVHLREKGCQSSEQSPGYMQQGSPPTWRPEECGEDWKTARPFHLYVHIQYLINAVTLYSTKTFPMN